MSIGVPYRHGWKTGGFIDGHNRIVLIKHVHIP